MEEHYLSRRESAAYLSNRGLPVSPNTLMKFATTGGGPRYARWGNRAVYLPADLDAWVASKLKVRTSTSENN
jgi:hypothetical protein